MQTRFIALALALVACAGCDEDAIRLASETRAILAAYEKQLAAQIAVEQAAYARQREVVARATREQVDSNLQAERIERARALALELLEGRKAPSRWREAVRDYAKVDHAVQRERLAEEGEAESRQLARIQALQIDAQKIRVVRAALGGLAERRGIKAEAADLAGFAKDTAATVDKLVCDSIAAELKDQQTALAAAATDAAKQLARQAIAAAQELRKNKGCA